jgi:transglutaminase-like putative cysteine protease
MKFRREKGLLLGALALLAPLPLPLNQVSDWSSVVAFCLVVAVFLHRTYRGKQSILPFWVMNVLGLLYIPFLLMDLAVLRQGRFLQPLVHLAMFTLAVKLFGMRREKEKWHVLLAIFFLFIASVGTSVHPSVFLYLLLFLALAVLLMTRFAGLHAVGTHGRHEMSGLSVPLGGFITLTVLLVIAGSIPLFFFLPRLRRPYVFAPAAGAGSAVQISGFSDRIDLDVIGRVRTSRSVVLRLRLDNKVAATPEMRFKAATYDRYETGSWRRARRATVPLERGRDGFFHVGPGLGATWMSIWLRSAAHGRVVLPVETVVVDLASNALTIDETGVSFFLFPVRGTVSYRAGLGPEPRVSAPPPRTAGHPPAELDLSGVSPRIRALASEVMSGGSGEEGIRELERHLLNEYRYTLDLGSTPTSSPLERFLFETKEGHCEYFASSMVLMLRSQGIPARVVTGYLGADYNWLQGYYVVRHSHAHAWVEAYLPETGWRVYDPTPPDGRPQSESAGLRAVFTQAWDYVLFRWDRYVLTFGFYDQVDVFVHLRDLLQRLWGSVRLRSPDTPNGAPEITPGEDPFVDDQPRGPTLEPGPLYALPFMVVALAVAGWYWWRRGSLTATRVYRSLRDRIDRGDRIAATSTPPLEVRRLLAERFPSAARETDLLVKLYLEESFAERDLDDRGRSELRLLYQQFRRKIRATGRRAQ